MVGDEGFEPSFGLSHHFAKTRFQPHKHWVFCMFPKLSYTKGNTTSAKNPCPHLSIILGGAGSWVVVPRWWILAPPSKTWPLACPRIDPDGVPGMSVPPPEMPVATQDKKPRQVPFPGGFGAGRE